jgi:hypothetical protein
VHKGCLVASVCKSTRLFEGDEKFFFDFDTAVSDTAELDSKLKRTTDLESCYASLLSNELRSCDITAAAGAE